MGGKIPGWAIVSLLAAAFIHPQLGASEQPAGKAVVVAEKGKARLVIVVGSFKEPAAELRSYLQRISGAQFKSGSPADNASAVYVGLASDFPALKLDVPRDLGSEGFLLRTDGTNLYLIGGTELGVRHAVATFLQKLGCRWFFPGPVWEVVPKMDTIKVSLDERQSPSYALGRHIHYGFGAYAPCAEDLKHWNQHNRMGGPMPVGSGHTWFGLQPARQFAEHPDWFAEVGGTRKPTKPCYSHPEVIKQAVRYALEQAAGGARIVSMTPPDGLNFCECSKCMEACKGGKPFKKHQATYAERPDGVLINVTSESVFHCVNQVAQALADKHPNTMVGCYAYSAYAHPPSFPLRANVFVQTTTAYRRTDLTFDEQVLAFRKLGCQVGVRDYFSVYQWDWDVQPPTGKLEPGKIKEHFATQHEKLGIRSVNAEASNNWGPRGLSYYLAAQLLWDVNADVDALLADFHTQAFGPAAEPMKRYYRRWYSMGGKEAGGILAEDGQKKDKAMQAARLRELFQDLDEAARLAKDRPDCLARIDHLRMYAHYLLLRQQTVQAGAAKNKQAILDAVKAETTFAAHLVYTNMIHTRPLVGKAFERRFKPFVEILKEAPESQKAGAGWRQLGPAPTHQEVERFWAEDRAVLKW